MLDDHFEHPAGHQTVLYFAVREMIIEETLKDCTAPEGIEVTEDKKVQTFHVSRDVIGGRAHPVAVVVIVESNRKCSHRIA